MHALVRSFVHAARSGRRVPLDEHATRSRYRPSSVTVGANMNPNGRWDAGASPIGT